MSRKTEEIFSSTAHYCTVQERKNTHIGMRYTTATDGVSLSLSVMEVVENFGLEENIVGITSDDGGNLWVCREALESKYTNESIFFPPKTLFTMECLAHILAGTCKVGVQPIKSDDGEVDMESTRRNMQKFITWTKKRQKGARGSPGGTDSLRDQGEAPSHTCFELFCIPYPLLQVPAGQ